MKRRCFAVLALVVLLAAVAIGPAEADPLGPHQTGKKVYLPLLSRDFPAPLRINLGSYPDIVDPQISSFVNEIATLQLICEGLTRLDEHLATVPGAAESWQYNSTATQLTFTLRPNLRYSDGSLLNAARSTLRPTVNTHQLPMRFWAHRAPASTSIYRRSRCSLGCGGGTVQGGTGAFLASRVARWTRR
jgi:ABC-type transport system substrate-binding protein